MWLKYIANMYGYRVDHADRKCEMENKSQPGCLVITAKKKVILIKNAPTLALTGDNDG